MNNRQTKRAGISAMIVIGVVAVFLVIGAVVYVAKKHGVSQATVTAPTVSPTPAAQPTTAAQNSQPNSADTSAIDTKLNDIQTDQQGVNDSLNQPDTVSVD